MVVISKLNVERSTNSHPYINGYTNEVVGHELMSVDISLELDVNFYPRNKEDMKLFKKLTSLIEELQKER